jgi:hypothetical protein
MKSKRSPATVLLAIIALLYALSLAIGFAQNQTRIFLPIIRSAGTPTTDPNATATPSSTVDPNATATSTTDPNATATRTPTNTRTPTATRTTDPNATPTRTPTANPFATRTPIPGAPPLFGAAALRPVQASTVDEVAPRRYIIVLDASGSMNTNFAGQGTDPVTGENKQCARGPEGSPPSEDCGEPEFAWKVESERRIYVAKQGIERLIGEINLPGNPGYDDTRPADELRIIWFNERVPTTNISPWRSDSDDLRSDVRKAGSFNNDPYLSKGGTNGAAAFYRAAQLLAESDPDVEYNGETFTYESRLVYVTDGVSNIFLNSDAADLYGGVSSFNTFERLSFCYNLGEAVIEEAPCQTTSGGGLYLGVDRPLTQVTNQAQQVQDFSEVFVVAIGSFSTVGLLPVATVPDYFFVATTLESTNGMTNIDAFFEEVAAAGSSIGACRPVLSAETDQIPAARAISLPGLTYPQVGEVVLRRGSDTYRARVTAAADGSLSYSFASGSLPPGLYLLSAYLGYRGDDAVGRVYTDTLDPQQADVVPEIPITIPASGGYEVDLSLRFAGNVCSQ